VKKIIPVHEIDILDRMERIADRLRMIENQASPAIYDAIIDEQRAMQDRRDLLPRSWQCQVSWSIIIELGAAREEGRRACVKHALIASQAPTATVNRRLSILAKEGWIVRGRANHDHRLVYLSLTNKAAQVLRSWGKRRAERWRSG